MELSEIKFGAIARDSITTAVGVVTAKVERMNGHHQVAIEGTESTGRPFVAWIELDRVTI